MASICIAVALSFLFATTRSYDFICLEPGQNEGFLSLFCAEDSLRVGDGGSLQCTGEDSCANKEIQVGGFGAASVTCTNDRACWKSTVYTAGTATLTCEGDASCDGLAVRSNKAKCK